MNVCKNVFLYKLKIGDYDMSVIFTPTVSYSTIRYCDPKWFIPEEYIRFHNIMFIESGSCDIYIDRVLYSLTAGDVIYCPIGCLRSGGNADDCTKIHAFDFQLSGTGLLPIPIVSHYENFDNFSRDLKRFNYAWTQGREGYDLQCMGIFVLILHRLIYGQDYSVGNTHVKSIKHYIIDHSHEQLTVSGLAEKFGFSPAYCGALFKKSEGCSIQEFINTIRINKAKNFLSFQNMSITEIAYEVGYNDVFYFSKTFKKLTGVSPLQYRKQQP